MDVRLLGPLEVHLGDRPVELGPRKQRAVLAMLALEAGRTVSADRLAEGLWGDEPPPSAPKMVQLYVSHLRRVLDGDASIATRGRGYELQLPEGAVDTVRLERLLEESRGREALALWRGDPLADVADEPFAATEIRRLEELRLRAAEMAIDADLEAGRHVAVIGELDALVAANPLREHLHAQRMLALYRAGRQSEALAAYRDARAGLVEEIGVEPGAELQRLHEQILEHDPALDLPAAAEPEPARVTGAAAAPIARAAGGRRGSRCSLGITAFGVIRVLEPDAAVRDRRGRRRADRSGQRPHHRPVLGRPQPGAVTAGGGSVWVANRLDGTVSRIDRDRQVTTIPVGGAPAALAFGAGSLWVADGDSRFVAQVDPGSNTRRQRIPAAIAPRSLALAEGALWVISGAEGDLHRVELDHLDRARRIPIGVKATAIAAGAGALWVASEETDTVTRLDPRTGAVVAPVTVGHAPSALAVGEGAVWVVNRTDGTLSRIDPEHELGLMERRRRPRPDRGRGRRGRRVGGGRRGRHRRPRGSGRTAQGAALQGRQQPVGARCHRRLGVDRRGRARHGAPGRNAAGGPPAAGRQGPVPRTGSTRTGYFMHTWLLAGLTHDGLVAYRRVPGSPGRRSSVGSPRGRPAEPGRAHLRLHPATRPPLLRRDAGQAGRLPRVDGALPARASATASPTAPALLQRHRRRTALHQRGGALRPLARHRVGRARADDHRPPDRARPGLPPHADDAVRVCRAPRDARARR